jgi:hypothetical protein
MTLNIMSLSISVKKTI